LKERRPPQSNCYDPIVSRKLFSNGISIIRLPIKTILPVVREVTSTFELLDSGESKISNTSRTPCTIFTSPFERGSLAFNLCTSMLPWSSSFTGFPWSRVGSLESQRMDLSQASRFGNCPTCKTGTLIVTVAMVYGYVSSGTRTTMRSTIPDLDDCGLCWQRQATQLHHRHEGLIESLQDVALDRVRSHEV